MKLLHIQILTGPNRHSQEHFPLIQAKVQMTTERVTDWKKQLALNGLILDDQSSVSDVLRQLMGYLYNQVGVGNLFYHHIPTAESGVSLVVFQDPNPQSGKQIIQFAMEWMESIAANQRFDLNEGLKKLIRERAHFQPQPNVLHWLETAKKHHIPASGTDETGRMCFGYGKNRRCFAINDNPQMVFADGKWRIPLIAVTGSNGKTTTTRLIAYMALCAGFRTGFTTSDGIYIGDEMVDRGDTTGPVSARRVLEDESVEFAVLESARGGIVRAGLAFTESDVAVVTNVQEDHLGIADIHTIEELARVKQVVAATASQDGYAVLNACNTLTVAMAAKLRSHIAWFCAADKPEWLSKHIEDGGAAAMLEEDAVVLYRNRVRTELAGLADIPITFNGTLGFMVENALAAALAASCCGQISDTAICKGLKSFEPSEKMTPGRMNIYSLQGDIQLLVDFAHNPDGFAGIAEYLSHVKATKKTGIIVGTGDRKDEDIRALGRIAASMFDKVYIYQVKFLRGRTAEEITGLLVQGIQEYDAEKSLERIPDESDPFLYTMLRSVSGEHITALSDVFDHVHEKVEQWNKSGFLNKPEFSGKH